jgi:hypothetical protein
MTMGVDRLLRTVAAALACFLLCGAPALAARTQAEHFRQPKKKKTIHLGRSYYSSKQLYARYDTQLRLPKTSQELRLKLQDKERLLKWRSNEGEWEDITHIARSGHATVGDGSYSVLRPDGSERQFGVTAGAKPPKPEPRLSRAARYRLQGIRFAPARSPLAAQFDNAVARFFAQLATRGPMVSREVGDSVRYFGNGIADLEERRNSRVVRRRVVRKPDGAMVADYFVGARAKEGRVLARLTVAAPAPGRKELELTTPLTQPDRASWSFGGGRSALEFESLGRRVRETTQGGITTGESQLQDSSSKTTYRVSPQGARVDEQWVERTPDSP